MRKPKRPPEHIAEPRPEPMPPLDRYKVKGTDEARLVRWLLCESIRRLRAARHLEQSRAIIYPETTSILRDVERLSRRLNLLAGTPEAAGGDELSTLLQDV